MTINETKRDVFDAAMSLIRSFEETFLDHSSYHGSYTKTKYFCERYDAALPDDLPVTPLTVGEYIEEVKAHGKFSIIDPLWRVSDALSTIGESVLGDRSRWVLHHSDDFARAWVLGVWRVEETGEIVKLEAEE